VDSEDSEEDSGVERTERHVIKSDSDSETNAVGGGSGCAGGDDGNGEETEIMMLIVNMIMRIWMSVLLVILLLKEKQPHKQGIATKM
jgi:hypothetical protein